MQKKVKSNIHCAAILITVLHKFHNSASYALSGASQQCFIRFKWCFTTVLHMLQWCFTTVLHTLHTIHNGASYASSGASAANEWLASTNTAAFIYIQNTHTQIKLFGHLLIQPKFGFKFGLFR